MALYGLVQAPRAWYDTLTAELIRLGFRISPFDPCIYIHTQRALIISVHVDDIQIYALNRDIIATFKAELSEAFTITTPNPNALYLGMHIKQDNNSITIHQKEYVRRFLDKYDLHNVLIAKTPCDHRVKLTRKDNKTATPAFQTDYLQKNGSINYLPTLTQIDLAYTSSLYGRFNSNLNQSYMDGVTRSCGYIKGTLDVGITYTRKGGGIRVYVDADWAGYPDTRQSTIGYIVTIAGGPVCWYSSRQKIIALSTYEAEYITLTEATKEAIWVKGFINDLNVSFNIPTVPLEVGSHFTTVPIFVDNQAAIKLAYNPEFHKGSKHINTCYHFVREHTRNGDISV
jgi:hypothetical protein